MKKLFIYTGVIFIVFIIGLYFTGYFNIGLLSDDYPNFYDATHSDMTEKITGKLPFTNTLHLRPIYYQHLYISKIVSDFLGFEYDNFTFFRIQNLILFLAISLLASLILFKHTDNLKLSLIFSASILIYPNNLHNICWTAARVDLLLVLFSLLSILFTYYYLKNQKWYFNILINAFVLFAFLTKESAIILPLVILAYIFFNFDKKSAYKNKKIFYPQLVIFCMYFIIRMVLLQHDLVSALSLFQSNPLVNAPGVIARNLISLSIPIDYLNLKSLLIERHSYILMYLALIYSLIIYITILITKLNANIILIKMIIYYFILIIPYILIGYFRPQMVLFSFIIILMHIFIIYNNELKLLKGLKRYVLRLIFVICFISWTFMGMQTIKEWTFAFSLSKDNIQYLLEKNIDFSKETVVIGNPGRIKQSYMFNKLSGAYSYWKFQEFSNNATIIDLVQTASLDIESINSLLIINKLDSDYFEIKTSGTSQFFWVEGLDNERLKEKLHSKYYDVEFNEFNKIGKPIKMKIKKLNKIIPFYLMSKNDLIKIE